MPSKAAKQSSPASNQRIRHCSIRVRESKPKHAVHAAEAAARLARAERDRAVAEKEFADAAVVRTRELRAKGVVSKQAIDDAERADRSANAALVAADAAIGMRDHELARARAALTTPTPDAAGCACVDLRAPISGRVLRIAEKSETAVHAGSAAARHRRSRTDGDCRRLSLQRGRHRCAPANARYSRTGAARPSMRSFARSSRPRSRRCRRSAFKSNGPT